MKHTTIGLDLAKNIFQVHAQDENGKKLYNKPIKRDKLAEFFVNLPPCLVAMEACSSANYWGRKIAAMGHQVRLIAPQHVKPYVQGSKHDAADASAICEAVGRKRMRFVALKTVEQQAEQFLHRSRSAFIAARTAQGNAIRGYMAEYGLILPQGINEITSRVPALIEDASNDLPGKFRILIDQLLTHFKHLSEQIATLDVQIKASSQSPMALKLQTIPGIGPVTASALVAALGDASTFKNGRQLAAWVGLVPAQHSSGGKTHMLGISKRGDGYLRTLLIHGARAVMASMRRKQAYNLKLNQAAQATVDRPDLGVGAVSTVGLATGLGVGLETQECNQGGGMADRPLSAHQLWLERLGQRKHPNVACVALAAKNARIVWAVMRGDRTYEPGYVDARYAQQAQTQGQAHARAGRKAGKRSKSGGAADSLV